MGLLSAPRIDSKVASDSDEFRARAEHNRNLAQKLRANPIVSRILEKVAGVFLIGFGIKLIASR